MPAKIPATVVTGFLGSGKTTLISHLLQNADGRRIALIVNEFGDLGVDGDILKGCGDDACAEGDVVELSNGCICCTVAEDFVPAMRKLLGQRRAARPYRYRNIRTCVAAAARPRIQLAGDFDQGHCRWRRGGG